MSGLFGEIGPGMVLAMIPGVVQLLKEWFGLEGIKAQVAVFVVAAVLFALVQVRDLYGVFLNPWLDLVWFSLLGGMAASGYYKLVKVAANRFQQ